MDDLPNLSYVFIIFFLTLGPLKVIPVFSLVTHNATAIFRRQLATKAALLATLISLLIAIIGSRVIVKWGVSVDALKIAGGLLLLIAAQRVLSQFSLPEPLPSERKSPTDNEIDFLAISPLTIPAIITPYGVVAILVSMVDSYDNLSGQILILEFLSLIMLLNWLAMLFSQPIINTVKMITLLVMGWIFAVMQAALAIEFIIKGIKNIKDSLQI